MMEYEFIGDSSESYRVERAKSAWETQRQHREIVTKMIGRVAASGAKTLCVFGAGPCNDIELNVLSELFEQVSLVDIDAKTMRAGFEAQCRPSITNIMLFGNIDLLGSTQLLKQYSSSGDESLIRAILKTTSAHQPAGLSTHDCVASTCMLSQLLNEASKVIQHTHDRFVDVLKAIRLRHIQIMCQSLNPGGQGILITDIVSSDSLPDLQTTKDLNETLRQAIANQNYLHGLNPPLVAKVFEDESLTGQISSVKISEPWLWSLPKRTYACFAVSFTKSPHV